MRIERQVGWDSQVLMELLMGGAKRNIEKGNGENFAKELC